jgi:two-component system phosphate regulon sensor histidine kinase PhoR
MVKRLFGLRKEDAAGGETEAVAVEAERGRAVIEESREIVVVLDADGRVVAASRRARHAIPGLREGQALPETALQERRPLEVPFDALGGGETILYLSEPAENAAYEELRAGFTAAVSHELRTPLARLLALLESASLPDSDARALVEQARGEVEEMGELIDDILFLSELETGRQVVALSSTSVRPIVAEVVAALQPSAERAGVTIAADFARDVSVPLRPRMLQVVLENLVGNAIRYAGPEATCRITVTHDAESVVLEVADDGPGVDEGELPRLFERFYRTDRARASRGTGLGLAIVKHIVTAAGGTVEASAPGRGLTIRALFPSA